MSNHTLLSHVPYGILDGRKSNWGENLVEMGLNFMLS